MFFYIDKLLRQNEERKFKFRLFSRLENDERKSTQQKKEKILAV